ncbi:unnamed protein product [Cylicocyclus nassatus]|uniref:Transmembrane protein 14 n=1 Tax=Cylicocyclus nassatus TaxID=53992 RepID=A0AA36M314_CYLNA|nr:unnamed protein product [Cylicocyclus nassatus]
MAPSLATTLSTIASIVPSQVNPWYAGLLVAGGLSNYLQTKNTSGLIQSLLSGAAVTACTYYKLPYKAIGVLSVAGYLGWTMLKKYLAMKKRKIIPSGLTAIASLITFLVQANAARKNWSFH